MFKLSANDKFNHQADWQELYDITKRWKTDLALYKQDVRLLKLVVETYFSDDFEDKTRNMEIVKNNYLLHLKTYCHTLIEQTNNHLNCLTDLIENPFHEDYDQFKKQHKYLKADIGNFLKLLRRMREEFFKITEHYLQTKQLEKENFVRIVGENET
jgi:hypothetical protein